jgi:hypothetical protein
MINPLDRLTEELTLAKEANDQLAVELARLRQEYDLIAVQPWELPEEQ